MVGYDSKRIDMHDASHASFCTICFGIATQLQLNATNFLRKMIVELTKF